MFVLGTAMSFGAFKFAAQSLLSGLGSVQFLSQVVFSRFVLHEKVEEYAYVGVFLIIAGCIFIVIFGAHQTKNYKVSTNHPAPGERFISVSRNSCFHGKAS